MIGRAPQQGQGIGMPDFVWLNGLAGGNNLYCQTVTATPGGAQAGAVVIGAPNAQGIEAALINIGTVVSANDSTQLPQAIAGKELTVINTGAQTARIYANATTNKSNNNTLDVIAGVANATPVTIATNATAVFFCAVNGIWGQK